MALPDGAASIYAKATRITQLDEDGYVDVGAPMYVTDTLVKVTFTPSMETGDDLNLKDAKGDLAVRYKHGDMLKYYTMQVEFATPDPGLEHLLCGGAVLLDNTTVALGAPAIGAATGTTTGGVLPAASYDYVVTAYNQYGETVPSTVATGVVTSGTAGKVTVAWTPLTGAQGYGIYGRTHAGQLYRIAYVAGQATASYVDTGAITPAVPPPSSDTTAGPGTVGYQAPALGVVGNPNGVSLEFWSYAVLRGNRTPYLPYWHWVFPCAKNFHQEARTLDNTIMPNIYVGEAFESDVWGTGPVGDWQFDSTKVWQRARVSREMVPTPSLTMGTATV